MKKQLSALFLGLFVLAAAPVMVYADAPAAPATAPAHGPGSKEAKEARATRHAKRKADREAKRAAHAAKKANRPKGRKGAGRHKAPATTPTAQ